jgi:integrase
METDRFPRVKNVIKKRTKNGQRYLLHDKDACGNDIYLTIPIVEEDTEKDYFRKIQDARIKLIAKKNGDSFEQLLNEYIKKRGLEQNTIRCVRRALRGFTLNNAINKKKVNDLIHNSSLKPGTIKTTLGNIRSFYRWLIFNGSVDGIVDPTNDFKLRHVVSRRTRTLTPQEERFLLDNLHVIRSEESQLIVRMALFTGARVSSICELKPDSISNGKVYYYNVKTKHNYDYPIPIKDEETILLFNRLAKRGYLFGRKTKYYSSSIDYYLLKMFGKDKHGETISIHSLRHTFATKLIQKGVPPEIVSRLLDHSSPSITLKIYARHSTQQLEDAVDKIFE